MFNQATCSQNDLINSRDSVQNNDTRRNEIDEVYVRQQLYEENSRIQSSGSVTNFVRYNLDGITNDSVDQDNREEEEEEEATSSKFQALTEIRESRV